MTRAKGKAIKKAQSDKQLTASFPVTPTWRALSQLDKAMEEVLDIMNNPHDKTLDGLDYDVNGLTEARQVVQGLLDELEDAEAATAGK